MYKRLYLIQEHPSSPHHHQHSGSTDVCLRLESGHCFRFASFAVRSCGKSTLTAASSSPSRDHEVRGCREAETTSSTLHCLTPITLNACVCVFMCVIMYMYVQCAGGGGEVGRWGRLWGSQSLTFNLNAHKSRHEQQLRSAASFCSPRFLLQINNTTQRIQLLSV